MTRTVVAWCPEWPLVAASAAGTVAAVLRANRVVALSAAARAEGVRLGQRRREAEAASSDLVFVPDDPVRDVRAFEPVIRAVSAFAPQVEVTRPGVCSLAARGPARYFGGEEALAALIATAASTAAVEVGGVHSPGCRVGIADTAFAARLAARDSVVVAPGETARWLAGFPVGVLADRAVAEFLTRLGIHRLGDFAAMDEAVVSGRLGAEGTRSHRLARGLDDHRLVLGEPLADLSVQRELEDEVDQVETVAFIAAGLAEELVLRLSERSLSCTRLLVEASTAKSEELSRWWRADRPLTPRAMVDRVRWQVEGWLGSPGGPSAGITLVRLTAGEVAADNGRQLGLLGESEAAAQHVERAVARVQGLLGHESVSTGVLAGGRAPSEQVRLVCWGEPRPRGEEAAKPWPGRLPPPAPSVVYEEPVQVSLRDHQGRPIEVSGRGRASGAPARLWLTPGEEHEVTGFAGPWPSDERWWDPALHTRKARMQVMLDDGSAHVLALERGRWAIEATYD